MTPDQLEELRREILIGAEQAARGELVDASVAIEDIRQRLRARHSSITNQPKPMIPDSQEIALPPPQTFPLDPGP
jgi:hypothetical protein